LSRRPARSVGARPFIRTPDLEDPGNDGCMLRIVPAPALIGVGHPDLTHGARLAIPRLPQPTAIFMPDLAVVRMSGNANSRVTAAATSSSLGVTNFCHTRTMLGNGMSRPPAMLTSMRSPINSRLFRDDAIRVPWAQGPEYPAARPVGPRRVRGDYRRFAAAGQMIGPVT
jgi:hypothetical protein